MFILHWCIYIVNAASKLMLWNRKMLLCSVTSPRIASAILAKQSAGRYRSLTREYRVNGICWIELLIIGNGKYGFYM